MKKKIAFAFLAVSLISGIAYACVQMKQCCKRDYQGNLQCVTKCDHQMCPFGYEIEIK